ncbi:MAG TPA: ubiquinone/menaquinone biosynthesis methyltransferase [Candidatus Saccharimonadales bacterium]|jgi:demethylmenaquinone methyltransferase/2-methoxy-6-polyprenyl-1,4-benzoquinol methylase|nr:ubiquinone/menaquinone biosynthesis methyltransferase [Candidatus Saccharimonadales bacterium]
MPDPTQTTGAAPAGAADEAAAARAVRQMFDEIAPRYDFLNHTLSMNVDRLWWRRTARIFRHILERQPVCVLDLCAGTGDMSVALRAAGPAAKILALDFSRQMLQHGQEKFRHRNIQPVEADALQLPLQPASVDLVVSAFGFRNLANYDAGLREIFRVLKAGGEVGILDFSEPGGWMGPLYGFYFRKVLPRIGTMLSGVKGPYEYLPASVGKFPPPAEMLRRMEAAGFSNVSWTPYTFGIAGLYRGKRT